MIEKRIPPVNVTLMRRRRGLTVKEMKRILSKLEKQGYADFEVYIGYDTDMAYTSAEEEYNVEHEGDWPGIYFRGTN